MTRRRQAHVDTDTESERHTDVWRMRERMISSVGRSDSKQGPIRTEGESLTDVHEERVRSPETVEPTEEALSPAAAVL